MNERNAAWFVVGCALGVMTGFLAGLLAFFTVWSLGQYW